ncbi:hypothetical protein V8C35DRAFT_279598 [Trichoderma chlorosporum]
MVGVPGKSQACSTCRKRKKRCDLQRPACGSCIRLGLDCGGYTRSRIWINQTPTSGSRAASYSARHDVSKGFGPERQPGSVTLHTSLASSAMMENVISRFWQSFLPNGRLVTARAGSCTPTAWLRPLEQLRASEPALQYALLALGLSTLACQDQGAPFRVKALQAYSMAVSEVFRALRSVSRAQSDGVIAAVSFGLDTKVDDGATAHQILTWHQHADGELAIHKSRTAEAVRGGLAHQLFIAGRLTQIIVAIKKRKRSPIDTPAWRTIPWELTEKSSKDKLLDILLTIPSLLETMDHLKTCSQGSEETRKREWLLKTYRACTRDLAVWRVSSGHDVDKFDYTVVGAALPKLETDEDFAMLYLTNLFWITSLYLSNIQDFIGNPQSSKTAFSLSLNPRSGSRTDTIGPASSGSKCLEHMSEATTPLDSPTSYACRIAHAIPLFLQPNAGTVYANAALFPMGVALQWFGEVEPGDTPSPEHHMMLELFQQPLMGSYVGRFLRNLGRNSPCDAWGGA